MKVEGMDVVVDEYVGRLTHAHAYEFAYELLQKARQAWPYYFPKPGETGKIQRGDVRQLTEVREPGR